MIFDPFQRTSQTETTTAGYGLGLYLVKTIIDQHGGEIELESTPNVSTTFRIHLPLERATG